MKTIQLEVDQNRLVKNLNFAFTNKTTYLGELIQNARRAGATKIEFNTFPETGVLKVRDNGAGILNMQNLLSIGGSDWSEDVIQKDSPYGLGFLSCLFASESVVVESNQQRISFKTAEMLDGSKVEIETSDVDLGTVIELTGIDLEVREGLKHFSLGNEIAVFLNGEWMPFDLSINGGLSFIDTDIGSVYLSGFDDDGVNHLCGSTDHTIVYLQGIMVYKSSKIASFTSKSNIVHLDPTQFKGRLPDRNVLVDGKEAIEKINQVIRLMWREKISKLIDATSDKTDLVNNKYWLFKKWGCLELLNDIDFLPPEVLGRNNTYPTSRERFEGRVYEVYSRKAVESGSVKIVNVDEFDDPWSGYNASMYAYINDTVCYTGGLDSEHWLFRHMTTIKNGQVKLVFQNERKKEIFSCGWFVEEVLLCESAKLVGPLGDVELKEGMLYVPESEDERMIVIPDSVSDGEVVGQAGSFTSEWDEFLEEYYERVYFDFELFLQSHRPGEECDLIKRIAIQANLPSYKSIQGKEFVVRVTESDGVDVRELTAA
jgi:primosomal replication protein N